MFHSLFLCVVTAGLTGASCDVFHHVFLRNVAEGIEVFVCSPLPGNVTSSALITGARLPPECGARHARCSLTPLLGTDGDLVVLVPVEGGLKELSFRWLGAAGGWSLAWDVTAGTPGRCSPVSSGPAGSSELGVLCLNDSSKTAVAALVSLRSDASGPTVASIYRLQERGLGDLSELSNPVYVDSQSNCPLLSSVVNTMVFVGGDTLFMTPLARTVPDNFLPYSPDDLRLGCPPESDKRFEYYGDNTFLLRCSTFAAHTINPCRSKHRFYDGSVPFPCSTWEAVVFLHASNNTLQATYRNGTSTRPIAVTHGSIVDAGCVNPTNPHFVYSHANGSVMAIRVLDGFVTELGIANRSEGSSNYTRLQFTEHGGSFFVGFIDSRGYKMVNFSCSGSPDLVELPFNPDLTASFVGPGQRDCVCAYKDPLVPGSSSSVATSSGVPSTGSGSSSSVATSSGVPSTGSGTSFGVAMSSGLPGSTITPLPLAETLPHYIIKVVAVSATVGFIIILVLLFVVMFIACRRRRKRQELANTTEACTETKSHQTNSEMVLPLKLGSDVTSSSTSLPSSSSPSLIQAPLSMIPRQCDGIAETNVDASSDTPVSVTDVCNDTPVSVTDVCNATTPFDPAVDLREDADDVNNVNTFSTELKAYSTLNGDTVTPHLVDDRCREGCVVIGSEMPLASSSIGRADVLSQYVRRTEREDERNDFLDKTDFFMGRP